MKTSISKREMQVAELLAWGYSDKEIAEELFISFDTVRTHHRNIYQKLDLRNLSDITRWYFESTGSYNFGLRPAARLAVSLLFLSLTFFIEFYGITSLRARNFKTKTVRETFARKGKTKETYLLA